MNWKLNMYDNGKLVNNMQEKTPKMKLITAYIFYQIGDVIGILLRFRYLFFLYPIYNKLMIKSSDLDVNCKIWKKPNNQ